MIPLKTHSRFNISPLVHSWTASDGPDFRGSPETEEHAGLVSRLASAVHLPNAAWVTQVHGGDVIGVETGGWSGRADGLWTDKPGLGVVGRSADCPLVLIGGPKVLPDNNGRTHAWGFAHASWRSTLAGISSSLVNALAGAGVSPADMRACICPSAGPCCYEVGQEVVAAAEQSHPEMSGVWFPQTEGKTFFNLWQANIDILVRAGIPEAQILSVETCTICNSGYFSFRRDGDSAGRIAAIIGSV